MKKTTQGYLFYGLIIDLMPNLKHLLEELEELDVDPRQIKLPGVFFDDLVQQGEDIEEENEE